jgi:hypothetical protein
LKLLDIVDYIEQVLHKITKELSMSGRFGKYGNAMRKAQTRKTRLGSPDLQAEKQGRCRLC